MFDAARRKGGSGRWGVGISCAALLALAFTLAACGTRSVALPPRQSAGAYTSATYHFHLTYPAGWKLTTLPGGSAANPLSIEITHVGAAQTEGAFLSTFSIAVIDTTSAAEATPIAQLKQRIAAAHSSLTPLTLSGHSAYQDAPTQQKSPDGSLTVTHTDYYLLAGRYEYSLATESVSSDSGADAALLAMVQSFTLQSS